MDELARAAGLQQSNGTNTALAWVFIVGALSILSIVAAYAYQRMKAEKAASEARLQIEREAAAARLKIEEEERHRQAEERALFVRKLLGDGNGNPGALATLEKEVRATREQGEKTHAMMEAHLSGGPPSRDCQAFIRSEVERAVGAAR